MTLGHLPRPSDVRLNYKIEAEEDLRRAHGAGHVSPHRKRRTAIIRTDEGLKSLNERVSNAKESDAVFLGGSSFECGTLKGQLGPRMPGLTVAIDARSESHRDVEERDEGRPAGIVGVANRLSVRPTRKLESRHDPGVECILPLLFGRFIGCGEALEEFVPTLRICFDRVESLLRSDTTQLCIDAAVRIPHPSGLGVDGRRPF